MAEFTLGDRMKEYESTTQSSLLRKTPVLIRLDGRAFHTFTKKLKYVDPTLSQTPFSILMHNVMTATTATLFNEVQNCVLAYTQSDEISLLLRDWNNHETQQWFSGNIQKIVSISASIATAAFNNFYKQEVQKSELTDSKYQKVTTSDFGSFATFDSRVFNLPREEVTNYFIWRQQDASRNSVQMLGHFHFSQKEMHCKNNSEVQDMLMLQKQINWNDINTWMKRGSCITLYGAWNQWQSTQRSYIDDEIPVFTAERDYIEQRLEVPETSVDIT